MMKKIILMILLSCGWHVAYAVKMSSIYEAEIPVSSQGEQQRNQAIQQAFIQALNKISASADVLQYPAIQAALPDAKSRVQAFGYVSSKTSRFPFLLKVQFDPKAMKKLLRQAKVPIWDESRPLMLVWISLENPGQAAEIIDSESRHELAMLLRQEANKRGLPFLLPMMDLTELNQGVAASIRSRSVDALQKASDRYHSDGMLIGNIEYHGKEIQGYWKLVLGHDQWEWNLSSGTAPMLMTTLLDKIVATLGERYAAVQTEKAFSSLVLVIKGVSQQDDFENLMRVLKHISLIKNVEIEKVDNDEVILHLDIQGAQNAFIQDASIGQHLKLQLENGSELTYLWIR